MKEFKILEFRDYIWDKKAQVIIVKTLDGVRYFYTFGADFTFDTIGAAKVATLKIDDEDAFEGTIQFIR